MSDIVIKAENIGKKYVIGHQAEKGGGVTFREELMQNIRTLWIKTKDLAMGKPIIQGDTMEEVWALKEVSFEIHRGEAVGIIGRNGAGKSTLLKILSRITEPSTGRVTIKGRVASLLEVGTGFHAELSGRENIYLNGTILGMTRQEIKHKFDEIVAFAEVEKYLDTPVKRYSSGMYVRLAFAVAAHLEPEILIVDEVLSVGDAQFQRKCLGKMGEVSAKEGRTVLFVSHNMGAIRQLCNKTILLENGFLSEFGTTSDIIEIYANENNNKSTISKKNITIKELILYPQPILSNQPVQFNIQIHSDTEETINSIGLLFYNQYEQRVAILDLRSDEENYRLKPNQVLNIKGTIEQLPLVEGTYKIGIFFGGNYVSENILDILTVNIINENKSFIHYPAEVRGFVNLNHSFTYEIN